MTDTAFHEPRTVEEAARLLADIDGARCLAGGQTLVAMLNARLVETPALVSLDRIPELKGIADHGAHIELGAMATHRSVATSSLLVGAASVLRQAAAVIAHPAVRNFGTLGGSLGHADPSSDYPAAVVAADATIVLASRSGQREVPARDFFLDYFTVRVSPGELISAVKVPKGRERSVGHYLKFSRVDGDWATVAVAVVLTVDDGVCTQARVALNSCGSTPVFDDEADAALVGSALEPAAVARASDALLARADPVDDVRGSAAYRRALVPKLVGRAVSAARSQMH